MFTGIITAKGRIKDVDTAAADRRYWIETPWDMSRIGIGASIACAGCCLTVVEKKGSSFTADVSAETLQKTTLASWTAGTEINLEPSLKLGDEMGGHIVSGHVDGLATVESIVPEGGSHRLRVRVPAALKHFIAPKGSVALDGVSLTVNEVEDDVFGVNIIPHTWAITTFGNTKAGGKMNLEVDLLARYAARILGR